MDNILILSTTGVYRTLVATRVKHETCLVLDTRYLFLLIGKSLVNTVVVVLLLLR